MNYKNIWLYGMLLLSMSCTNDAEVLPEDEEPVEKTEEVRFMNPIGGFEADPWVIFHDGHYYYCATSGNGVDIRKSRNLHTVARATKKTVWTPTPDGEIVNTIWAPELHRIGDKWYIYAAGSPCGDFRQCYQESFVLESNTDDAQGFYTYKGIIAEGIDGTVLQKGEDKYFVWMRTHDQKTEHISIAKMKNPWEIEGEVAKVSKEPFLEWETRDQYTNEGPAILQRGDSTLVVYSGSASWTEWYCLGTYVNTDGDFLNANSWVKYDQPLFQKSEENKVFGPGHCSFTKSPDGTEDWIMYHALTDRFGGWGGRTPRIQKFSWTVDGLPHFGAPWAANIWHEAPSGSTK